MGLFGNKNNFGLNDELSEKINVENLDYSLVPTDSITSDIKKNQNNLYGHPIDAMMQENRSLDMILKEIKKLVKQLEKHDFPATWRKLHDFVKDLRDIEFHFKRKDEILYKYLEKLNIPDLKKNYFFYHAQAIKDINNLNQAVKIKNLKNVKFLFSTLNDLLRKIIYDEEFIIFPTALNNLTNEEWLEIRKKGPSVGYSWICKDNNTVKNLTKIDKVDNKLDGFALDTGFLSIEMIDLVFNNIASEITVINEDGIIVYYNKEITRFFERSIDYIGKNFKECFTPKNSKNISKIMNDLKSKKVPYVELWFPKNENQIYVKYIPLFDKNDKFKGVLELIYDITRFKKMDGSYSTL